jgi:glycosyltransferase involved in cell wall biosynthesis
MVPRVLFVDQSGEIGGAELSLLDIARHFAGSGLVALFQPGPFADLVERSGVPLIVLGAKPVLLEVRRDGSGGTAGTVAAALLDITRRLARTGRKFDLLYANTQKAFVAAALAGLWLRKPVIWHLRDILSADHFGRANLRLVVGLTRLPNVRVIANSNATADAFVAAGGRRGTVTVIQNGLDPVAFARVDAATAQRLRAELGLSDGLPVVGLFGRLAPWKGQHVLIEALTGLPGAQALIVGDALFGEDAYREQLKDQARRADLGDRVTLAGFRSDIAALMQLCDVVVHTSTAPEPFGRVIVEAMLSGKPVIASDSGGAAEIIEHGHSGVLIPPGDPVSLAGWISHLLTDHRLAGDLAAAGRQRAIENFGLDRALAAIEAAVRAAVPPANPLAPRFWRGGRIAQDRLH